ncbi:hypothetical protein MXD61_24355 [Frankia sp. AgPm24]|uniref:hypothetical protein n=1 Tax=Frankia sp. AgPm24 TaxID=631128 RepID=UPI0020104BEE|nr:hypothetical protein [Frankia sp. AgPm24]MCK9924960.1 hypothetical protein [Frankia sp. AgPm24]
MEGEWALPGVAEIVARRLIIIVVTASALSALAGVVIGRYGLPYNPKSPDTASVQPSPSSGTTPTPQVSASTQVLVPAASATAAPDGSAADRSQVPGIPTRINQYGIPVGYPRTQAGAVSACANYDAINGSLRNREPTLIRNMYGSIATPDAAKKISDIIISNDKESAKAYGVPSIQTPNFTLIGRATGYSVQAYDENEAKVTIWGIIGFGIYGNSNPDLAPREGWGTDDCRVIWSDGDWRLADASDGPASPDITERAAEGFKEFLLVGAGRD